MIYDYRNEKLTPLSHTIALQAKRDLATWQGVIEAGPDIARSVLKNQVSPILCEISGTHRNESHVAPKGAVSHLQ
jgi:hypothetical protein